MHLNRSALILALSLAIAPVGISNTGCNTASKLLSSGQVKYDLLISDDEECNSMWANYESQLKRRSDLIGNLVATVEGYAGHENATLVQVQQARSSATQIKMNPEDFSDPVKFKAYQQAQAGVSVAMMQMPRLQEAYPDLKANAMFAQLMTEITGTENRLNTARERFNEAVKAYNTELRHVSGEAMNLVATELNRTFKKREYFSATEDDKATPKVQFHSEQTPSVQPTASAMVAPASSAKSK